MDRSQWVCVSEYDDEEGEGRESKSRKWRFSSVEVEVDFEVVFSRGRRGGVGEGGLELGCWSYWGRRGSR